MEPYITFHRNIRSPVQPPKVLWFDGSFSIDLTQRLERMPRESDKHGLPSRTAEITPSRVSFSNLRHGNRSHLSSLRYVCEGLITWKVFNGHDVHRHIHTPLVAIFNEVRYNLCNELGKR